MSGLVGNARRLDNLRKLLSGLPKVVAAKAASAAVGAINAEAQRSFAAGESPNGRPWAESKVTGGAVDLVRSGALRRSVKYTAEGTVIRCVLGVKYAKWQIGKRPVFPRRGAVLPAAYREAIEQAIRPIIREHVAAAMEAP